MHHERHTCSKCLNQKDAGNQKDSSHGDDEETARERVRADFHSSKVGHCVTVYWVQDQDLLSVLLLLLSPPCRPCRCRSRFRYTHIHMQLLLLLSDDDADYVFSLIAFLSAMSFLIPVSYSFLSLPPLRLLFVPSPLFLPSPWRDDFSQGRAGSRKMTRWIKGSTALCPLSHSPSATRALRGFIA